MAFCKITDYEEMASLQAHVLEGLIRDYIVYLRQERRLSPATVSGYIAPIAHFYNMNDLEIRWKKLKKFKAKHYSVVEDKPYSREQIKTLIDVCVSTRQMHYSVNGFCWPTKGGIQVSKDKRYHKDRQVLTIPHKRI